ncbi:hypothetical protein NXS98_13205 [Fontisphaera persica]|uniref:hypothetical protein n=1 Tax=Fontisphaera persica TaxID=2974023 RepID=UPI0024C021F1|nr:hypothetical protein [Fontisphaera persica]WCJ58669.1 hypothetical protein NXS98_13205 [Fontisphaera persica]
MLPPLKSPVTFTLSCQTMVQLKLRISALARARRWLWTALILGCSIATASAADVEYYGVVKSGVYTQAVGSAPAPIGTNAFQFISFVIASSTNAVTNATVRLPNGTTRQLATNIAEGLIGMLASGTDALWLFSEEFATLSALDAAYPSSSSLITPSRYTMNMWTVNDGYHSHQLSYAGASIPPTPTILNLTNAQAIEPSQDFTVNWSSLAGGLIPRVVYFTVLDQRNRMVLSSPAPFTEGALDGNSTSYVIPANTLQLGEAYLGTLIVLQPALPNTEYATGLIGHMRTTSFPLRTVAPPPPAAAELREPRMDGEQFVFEIRLQPDQRYELQVSEDLRQWTTVQEINWPMNNYLYRDFNVQGSSRRFYRVIAR